MRTNWGLAAAILSTFGGSAHWASAVEEALAIAPAFGGGPMLPFHRSSGGRAHRAWRNRRAAGR